MDTSKHYSKRLSKLFKKNYDKSLDSYKADFLPIFVECFRFADEGLASELFHKFVTYSEREFKEAVYNLVNVFELFEENYDIENDPLNSEEWNYLKLIINDGSDELDLELIKYIMQVMLDLNHI